MKKFLQASQSTVFCHQQCFPTCTRHLRSFHGRISQNKVHDGLPLILQQRGSSEIAASTFSIRYCSGLAMNSEVVACSCIHMRCLARLIAPVITRCFPLCREAVQAQPSSTTSVESEDAWYNDKPEQRSSGETSTSGRHQNEYELLELPKAQNVRSRPSAFGAACQTELSSGAQRRAL
jgi:hypothetical protein